MFVLDNLILASFIKANHQKKCPSAFQVVPHISQFYRISNIVSIRVSAFPPFNLNIYSTYKIIFPVIVSRLFVYILGLDIPQRSDLCLKCIVNKSSTRGYIDVS